MHRIGNRIARIGAAVLACCVFSMFSGCTDPAEQTAKKTTVLTTEDQIRRIQEDPKMSPAAKEAAIRSMQYNQARGSAMGQTLKK